MIKEQANFKKGREKMDKGQQVKLFRYTQIQIQKRLRKSKKEQVRKYNTTENVSIRERKEKTGQ